MRVTRSLDEEESSRPPRSFDRNDNGRTSLDPTPMECSNLRNPSNLIIFVTNHFFTSKSLSFLPVSRVITRSLLELNRKLDRRGKSIESDPKYPCSRRGGKRHGSVPPLIRYLLEIYGFTARPLGAQRCKRWTLAGRLFSRAFNLNDASLTTYNGSSTACTVSHEPI